MIIRYISKWDSIFLHLISAECSQGS